VVPDWMLPWRRQVATLKAAEDCLKENYAQSRVTCQSRLANATVNAPHDLRTVGERCLPLERQHRGNQSDACTRKLLRLDEFAGRAVVTLSVTCLTAAILNSSGNRFWLFMDTSFHH